MAPHARYNPLTSCVEHHLLSLHYSLLSYNCIVELTEKKVRKIPKIQKERKKKEKKENEDEEEPGLKATE